MGAGLEVDVEAEVGARRRIAPCLEGAERERSAAEERAEATARERGAEFEALEARLQTHLAEGEALRARAAGLQAEADSLVSLHRCAEERRAVAEGALEEARKELEALRAERATALAREARV